jgi:DNA-binding NarL/FixJ family response regulator
LQALDRQEHPAAIIAESTSLDGVVAAVRAGLGVALLPSTGRTPAGLVVRRELPEVGTAGLHLDAVRVVARGDSLLFPAAIRRLAGAFAGGDGAARLADARLTGRELDVLGRMAAGRSNAEIAIDLVLSVETVKTHVGNVLAKLRARDRTQAVIAAYESRLITPGG